MSTRKKNILDKLGTLIPGYSGYSERADKRKSEKNFRNTSATLLERSERNIIDFQKELLTEKNLKLMKEWDMVRKLINTTTSVIKHANYGASSFFSENQIKEDELNQILHFDEKIANSVHLIHKTTENDLLVEQSIIAIYQSIKEINSTFLDRSNFISNFK